jgi:hypothetical protein
MEEIKAVINTYLDARINEQEFEESLEKVLIVFERKIRKEFIKKISLQKKKVGGEKFSLLSMGYNDCIEDIINEASKEGINVK